MAADRWFFDRIAPLYDVVMPPVDEAVLARALDATERPVRRVLDVGGGTGRATRGLDGTDRIVVDTSRGMLRAARGPRHRIQADATALPIRSETVDAVVIVDALHHFPALATVFEEARRVLAPDGVLVVRDFDRTTARGRLLQFAESALRFGSRLFTPAELQDELDAAGFDASTIGRGFTYTVVGRKPRRT